MISYTQQILTDGGMTGTDETPSEALWVGECTEFGIQATRTSTAAGTIKLQACVSNVRPNKLDGNSPDGRIEESAWEDVVDSEQSVGAGEGWLWSYSGAGFNWVRVMYINASGSGDLNVIGTVKSKEVIE